ncbi:MAG TPA: PepSY domain-containing protein [Metabacillus sp.]|nr:PepSY domain-containing protein [Metabacillus sp.]
MNRKKWFLFLGSIVIAGLVVFTSIKIWGPTSEAQALTEQEAKNKALEKYQGEIIETSRKKNEYHFVLKAETGTYLIIIDAINGGVVSIEQQEQNNENIPKENTKELLTEDEVKLKISKQGIIKSIELIQEETPYYQAIVEIENEEHTLSIDPYTGEIINSIKTSQRLLSESEAVDVALKKVQGEVDDVDFIEREGQTPYYLIEIETNEDRDATVQIDAYKKEVISITWEDQGDDKDS